MFERNQLLIRNKFIEYLLPAILMSSAISLATIVDSMLVGMLLGSVSLAAVGLTAPVIYGLNLLFMLFCVGGIASASIVKGQRDAEAANQFFTVSMVTGFICLTVFAAIVSLSAEPLSAALAQGNEVVQAEVLAYLKAVVWAGPALSFSLGLAHFYRVDGNPRASALVALLANAVNLALDYILIRFAGMGIAGAGLSTTLGYAAGIFFVMPYLFSKKRTFHFVWPGRLFLARLKKIVSVGLPKGLNQGTSLLRSMILNTVVLRIFGPPGMAAMAVCINALAMAAIFIGSASDTMLPIVATLYGEQDTAGIRGAAKTAARTMLIASTLIVLFFLAFPATVGSWFGLVSDADLAVMIPALRMFALSLPLYAMNSLLQNFYAATGRQTLASAMATLDGFVFVVLFALILPHIQPELFWLSYLFSGIATLAAVYFIGRLVRQRQTVGGMLLLKQDDPAEIWEASIPADVSAATGISEKLIAFGLKQRLAPVLANRLALAVEEMAVNTAVHGKGKNKKTSLDIRMRVSPSTITVSLRDNGVPFNPAVYTEPNPGSVSAGGIALVHKMASKVEYVYQLGFNSTFLVFSREQLG
ncbi:MAG TPA: hypothetical protein GXZ64_02320 [Clostridiaceae bacterium]|nr:hypothetical protein [Clostridiaceae bacterium]